MLHVVYPPLPHLTTYFRISAWDLWAALDRELWFLEISVGSGSWSEGPAY